MSGIIGYTAVGLWLLPPGPASDSKRALLAVPLAFYPAVGAVFHARLTQRLSYRAALRAVELERVVWTVGALLGAQLFFGAFMAYKAGIARAGFRWDRELAVLDTRLADGAYYAWFPVMAMMVLWMGWRRDRRFFLAFALTWILLGTGAAFAFRSAGPLYTGGLTPPAGTVSARVAEALWRAHEAGEPTSISAFPSMHVAMCTLYAVAAWRVSRPVAGALVAYGVMILVCSVALGWHYALDGYAAILGVLGIWWLVGRAMRHDRIA